MILYYPKLKKDKHFLLQNCFHVGGDHYLWHRITDPRDVGCKTHYTHKGGGGIKHTTLNWGVVKHTTLKWAVIKHTTLNEDLKKPHHP